MTSIEADPGTTPWAAGRLDGRQGPPRLLFGRTFEDPAIEDGLFPAGGTVLCIASAGDTARALAATGRSVIAVDINGAQIDEVRRRLEGHPARTGAAERLLAVGRALLAPVGWRPARLERFCAPGRPGRAGDRVAPPHLAPRPGRHPDCPVPAGAGPRVRRAVRPPGTEPGSARCCSIASGPGSPRPRTATTLGSRSCSPGVDRPRVHLGQLVASTSGGVTWHRPSTSSRRRRSTGSACRTSSTARAGTTRAAAGRGPTGCPSRRADRRPVVPRSRRPGCTPRCADADRSLLWGGIAVSPCLRRPTCSLDISSDVTPSR